jgi:hypothetical protein
LGENTSEEIEHESAENQLEDLHYEVISASSEGWLKYACIALLLSIGYLFIVVDFIDELLIPPERAFSFMLEEQVLGLIIPNLIIIAITPLVWSRIAKGIVSNQVVKSFELNQKEGVTSRPLSILGTLFGIETYRGNEGYFIEAEPSDTDLDDVGWVMRNRILSAISSNIGFTFYIAFFLNTLLTDDLLGKDALFLSIMVMQLVPLLISWIVPVNWIIKDAMIRHMDSSRFVRDTGEAMSNGILDRFIGIGGLIVGISLAYDLAYSSEATEITNILVAGVYFVFFFLLLSSGTIVVISVVYLGRYHPRLVNSVRQRLADVIPVARTRIERIDSHTDRLAVAGKTAEIESSSVLKAIAVLILIGIIVLCEYYVLSVIGPFPLW